MDIYVKASFVVLAVSVGLVLLTHRNLRQRERARKFRRVFIEIAEELVGKPDFPERHANHLALSAAVPGGWLTRYMVFVLFMEMIFGKRPRRAENALSLDAVPAHHRVKYAAAMLSLAISDSYRCALLGRIWRGANSWVFDAIHNPKPDADAHATRRVVEQVEHVQPPRRILSTAQECAA